MYSISLYVYYAVLRSDPGLFHHVNHKSFPESFLLQLSPDDIFVFPDNCSARALAQSVHWPSCVELSLRRKFHHIYRRSPTTKVVLQ